MTRRPWRVGARNLILGAGRDLIWFAALYAVAHAFWWAVLYVGALLGLFPW